MPPTERDIWNWIQNCCPAKLCCRAVIERNTGYVGGVGNTGTSMFKFGRSAGLLTGFLIAAGIPFEEVTPAVWQKALGITPRKKGKGAETKTAFKNRLKSVAQKLMPETDVTLATADSILIAEHCRRKHMGAD